MTSSISSASSSVSSSMLKQMQEAMFKKGDKNGDGKITSDEMSQMAPAGKSQDSSAAADMFSKLDTDSDGAISRLESDAAIAQMSQQMKAQGPPPPPPKELDEDSSSSSDSSVKSLLETLSSALESGDSTAAQTALASLKEKAGSNGSTSSDNPFLKDLESLSDALESGSTTDAQTILAGIQEKISSRPSMPPPPKDGSMSQNQDSQENIASTLKSLLESLTDESSTTATSLDNELKKILTTAIKSYLQQSSSSYDQSSSGSTSQLSSSTYA